MKLEATQALAIVVAKLTGLLFPATYAGAAHPFAGQPVFDQVKTYDFPDIDEGLIELLVFSKRAALVVITDEEQLARTDPSKIAVSFRYVFSILSTDRSYKDRQAAMKGDSETPGVLMINHAVVQGCVGEIVQGVVCEPMGGETFALTGKDRENNFGRIGWQQVLRIHAGTETFRLSRNALQTYAPDGA